MLNHLSNLAMSAGRSNMTHGATKIAFHCLWIRTCRNHMIRLRTPETFASQSEASVPFPLSTLRTILTHWTARLSRVASITRITGTGDSIPISGRRQGTTGLLEILNFFTE